jgi:endonuclease/exonuclease/phosphatase family metal-dependent hydrolase
VGGILLTGFIIVDKWELTLLNVYGPCTTRKSFWTKLKDSGILSTNNLIMAGDFNIILDSDEAWGATPSCFIDVFFKYLFASKNLIDIKPPKLMPTWRNGRLGQNVISRRLDIFMVSKELLSTISHYRTWDESPFFSDHAPIFF